MASKKNSRKKITRIALPLSKHMSFHSPAMLAAVTVTVLVGVYVVARLLAAGVVAFEADAGSLTGTIAVKTGDSTAAGGAYITFGATNGGTTPPPPPVQPPPPPPVQPPPPPPPSGNGVGGSGADMTPGRKCAAGTSGAQTISSGDLNSAVNSLSNGGTLVVNGGSYGGVSINGKSNLTICGAPGTRPRVSAGGGSGFSIGGGSTNIHIEGFEVSDSAQNIVNGVDITGGAHHIHIWDMYVHDLGGVGIGAYGGYCGHIDFRYNRVWNTAGYNPYHTSAISIYEPNNCGISTNADVGIYTDFMIGNTIYLNGEHIGGASDGNGIIWDDTLATQGLNQNDGPYLGRVLIANNLVVANGGRGIHVGPTSARADVINNTVYYNCNPIFVVPCDSYAGDTDSGYHSDDVRFVNNASYSRSTNNGWDCGDSSNLASSNNMYSGADRNCGVGGYQIVADPGFTNASTDPNTWNFVPRSGSPLINAGTKTYSNTIIPNVDITGKARPANPAIGAYEP